MKYGVSFILLCCFPLCELHTWWRNDPRIVNWIWTKNVPMSVQWNVWMVCNEFWGIVLSVCLLIAMMDRRQRNPGNFASAVTLIAFNVYGSFMYLYNFKDYSHSLIYFLLLPTWILIYIYGRRIRHNPKN
jgi:hypothetical protein